MESRGNNATLKGMKTLVWRVEKEKQVAKRAEKKKGSEYFQLTMSEVASILNH